MNCRCGLPMRAKAIFKGHQFYECFHCDKPCPWKGNKEKCTNCAKAA